MGPFVNGEINKFHRSGGRCVSSFKRSNSLCRQSTNWIKGECRRVRAFTGTPRRPYGKSRLGALALRDVRHRLQARKMFQHRLNRGGHDLTKAADGRKASWPDKARRAGRGSSRYWAFPREPPRGPSKRASRSLAGPASRRFKRTRSRSAPSTSPAIKLPFLAVRGARPLNRPAEAAGTLRSIPRSGEPYAVKRTNPPSIQRAQILINYELLKKYGESIPQ